MSNPHEVLPLLGAIPKVQVSANVPLREHARFGIGGPADVFAESADESAFLAALELVRGSGCEYVVLGGGSNLIVADEGYRGVVLRYLGDHMEQRGNHLSIEAGASLQAAVDFSIRAGLAGIHTMTGIPGWVGAAVYGNAGAYGRSIHQSVCEVRFHDGREIRTFQNAACEFRYRESVFKQRKDWIILTATLELEPGDAADLQAVADGIRKIRDEKYPPTMKCAGSIFKNLILAELPAHVASRVPESVVREGKVPSAYFLEKVGAKGMLRGGIRVAAYHANLIYNEGSGTSAETCSVIAELKERVKAEFDLVLEEEVQYVGFPVMACA
jgi:UDP-N-acetylmuramate dehydrogenase